MTKKVMAGGGHAAPPAQAEMNTRLQTSQMAHVAAKRAAVSRVLAKGNGTQQGKGISLTQKPPSAGSFKRIVAEQAGVPGGFAAVDTAIDQATKAGHFSPEQGTALKAHDGPLVGEAGANTIAKLSATIMKAPKSNARPI